MIYVTGDTHGKIDFSKLLSTKLMGLTEEDYVIICGDCGVLFFPDEKNEMIEMYSSFPFTILFVDGNHENFDLLKSFPVEEWNGGKVHKLSDTLIHLMRGQVFEIEGYTFFTFGGGLSIDKAFREPGISWWSDEMPTDEEINEGIKNLAHYDNKVDFVLTHDCPTSLEKLVSLYTWKSIQHSKSNEALEKCKEGLSFTHWYFGHYHFDRRLSEKYTCLYKDIICISPKEEV
ncbi:MAG: metallophosphoesterase [Roseburia sp.]|nr:metallophosphoesterase [Anaeroplasma bactoclasticum]MCM1195674.1 metallophosphoesterase [Roseburia sp.]MCM1556131.1 metallophosphoesterase [Anaeroplasma bactoclasticum]